MSKLCFVALVACFAHLALGSPADYHSIAGAYVTAKPGQGLLPNGHCNVVPGFAGNIGPGADCTNSILGPDVDLSHDNNYPTNTALPEDLALELADLLGVERHNGQWFQWYPRTNATASKQTLHIHKNRCSNGETAQHVQTDTNIYKKCSGRHEALVVNNTFHLPPDICCKTCDEQASCTGYITDETAAACSILTAPDLPPCSAPYSCTMYFLIGKPSMKKQKQENKTPTAQALQSSDNYFPIEGAYFGPGNQGQCTHVFGKNADCSSSPSRNPVPEIDRKSQIEYPFPVLPEKLLLAMADLNQAESAFHFLSDDANSVFSNALSWLPRTNSTASKQTTFVHKTRCADGVTGKHVTTAKNVYKKCSNVATDLVLKNAFSLPPSVCQHTCDQESFCVGYTIDETGSGCWILQQATNGRAQQEKFASYWLVGSP
jgi:hypothetical protein